jgi:hypothetical protein
VNAILEISSSFGKDERNNLALMAGVSRHSKRTT